MKNMAYFVFVALLVGCATTTTETASPTTSTSNNEGITTTETTSPTTSTSNNEGILTNVRDVFNSGLTAKCEMTTPEGSATMYISGRKSRVDAEANNQESHIINDGTYLYAWSGSEGVKMRLENLDAAVPENTDQRTQTPEEFATRPGVEIECRPTAVSDNKFVPPSNVRFIDLNSAMEQINQFEDRVSREEMNQFDDY